MFQLRLSILFICILYAYPALASHSKDKGILESLRLAHSKEWSKAYEQAQKSTSPELAHSLVQFKEMMASQEPVNIAVAFAHKNPWFPICSFHPDIEQKITASTNTKAIINWFKICPPKTSSSKLLAEYAKVKLDTSKADQKFFKLWSKHNLNPSIDKDILVRFHKQIPQHLITLKALTQIWQGNYNQVTYYNKFLPPSEQSLNRLRISYAQNISSYARLLTKYPSLKNDEYIQFHHITQLLKERKDDEAYKHFLMVNRSSNQEKWWKPTNTIVRNFIREKKYHKAYKIASSHQNTTGDEYQEAEWIAGWIALRFLHTPKDAVYHFSRSYLDCKYAECKSKAAYWLATSYKACGDQNNATKWYSIAGKHQMHFYGILALAEIPELKIKPFYAYTNKQEPQLNTNVEYITGAAYYMWISGNAKTANILSRYIAESTLEPEVKSKISDYFNTKDTLPILIQYNKFLANHKGPFLKTGYPTSLEITNHNNSKALYLAIIRQESGFDHKIVSPAGAVGLMQLIPSTAQRFAKILGLPHNAFKKDPKANVAKGVSYLDYLVGYFGHIVPAIASYNAGETTVNRWIKEFGDPAKMHNQQQILDWIESIPYGETRTYVKKVIGNMVVYENLLYPTRTTKSSLIYEKLVNAI